MQEGVSFGQRLENAIESLALIGYREIVIVGRDCPDLEPVDIRRAFELLDNHPLVLGPDHRGGCYLIGIHANDREKLHGIRWQRNTDFQEICQRFANDGIFRLAVKIDLDTIEDICLLASSKSPFRWVAKTLLELDTEYFAYECSHPQTGLRKERIHWQLPPPHASVTSL